ncbi:MAG TPA: iron-sulfur cluster carrier protein ApbC [Porticoccaceae bacterium]|nr:iron-sulfur cluster carrier protein ApbC [Porticoccaceae bacterium]
MLTNVKNIIAIASGKGGVGKSTTAVNVALALHSRGQRVGLLDADIYGPSIALMLGVDKGTRPEAVNEKYFKPVVAHGIKTMSMAYMVTEKTPMAWRGPMAAGALQQLLQQTAWEELDVLIVDMPPGTGDIQLTLAQKAQVAGAVIVTTPQDIALLDAKKGIEMFLKVNIPVLGIVENMAVHVCSQCGHHEHIFGDGGGTKIAAEYQTQLLGSLALDAGIRVQGDLGIPAVVAFGDSYVGEQYRNIADSIMSTLALTKSGEGPTIVFE